MEALAKSDRLNLDINVNHSSPLYLLNMNILILKMLSHGQLIHTSSPFLICLIIQNLRNM